jgi:hypothetical protein
MRLITAGPIQGQSRAAAINGSDSIRQNFENKPEGIAGAVWKYGLF